MEEKKTKDFISYYDFFNNINRKGKLIDPVLVKKCWNSHQMNTIFSFRNDTIFFAHEADQFSGLPEDIKAEMEYSFYYYGLKESHYRKIDPDFSFRKAPVDEETEAYLSAIMEMYGFSRLKALEVYEWLPDEEKQRILNSYSKGGI